MNEKIQFAVAVLLGVLLSLSILMLLDFHKRVMDGYHNEVLRLNWEPSIGQLQINGTMYYVVNVGHYPKFATTNLTEAVEWAMNFTKEWGWIWKP